jgi:sugar phosphate isomerase/epimerase
MMDRPISINQRTVPHWSLGELIDCLRGVPEVQGVGLWPWNLGGINAAAARRLLRDEGLSASSLAFAPDFVTWTADSVAAGRRAIDDAYDLRAPVLLVHALPDAAQMTEEARRGIRRGLVAMGRAAGQARITLALDAAPPKQVRGRQIIVDLEQALELVQGVENGALALDTWNVCWDPRLKQKMHRAAGWIGLVELADWREDDQGLARRVVPGDGMAGVAQIVVDAQAEGYVGWYEIQLAGALGGLDQYPQLVSAAARGARSVLGSPEAMAVMPTV